MGGAGTVSDPACGSRYRLLVHHQDHHHTGSSSSSSSSNSDSDSDTTAVAAINSNTILRAAHEACQSLGLFASLGFSAAELRLDMQLVEASYLANCYHNSHHGADVVSKSARTLQRDQASLRQRLMEAQGLTAGQWGEAHERRFVVWQLAVILAAAMHDALHPGFNNAYLKATKHAMALTYGTAEQASVAFFQDVFMGQQHVLSCLSAAEQQLLQEVVIYAIAQTDMQVHAHALQWQAAGELGSMQHLAAIIVHAADLGNGADDWATSKIWARMCNEEFHAQGDHSREYHPGLPVAAMNDRSLANVPNSQLFFINTFAMPTFKALEAVAPVTAAAGLQGCRANAAICRAIMQRNEACMLQRVMYALGLGKLPRFL